MRRYLEILKGGDLHLLHQPTVVTLFFVGVCAACAQHPEPEPEDFEFQEGEERNTESSKDVGGEYSKACEEIRAYEKKQSSSGRNPLRIRVSSDKWAPASNGAILHTRAEGLEPEQVEGWLHHVEHATGHMSYSVRGSKSLLKLHWKPKDPETPPVTDLVGILEACQPRSGVYHSLGGPVLTRKGLHMFECAPGMDRLEKSVLLEREVAESMIADELKAAWRIGNVVVQCEYPKLHVVFVGNDGEADVFEEALQANIPPDLRKLLESVLETSKHNYKENWVLPPNRPDDYWPSVERYVYLHPLGRGWRTRRLIRYDEFVDCSSGGLEGSGSRGLGECADNAETEWRGPFFFRHWKYFGAYESSKQ